MMRIRNLHILLAVILMMTAAGCGAKQVEQKAEIRISVVIGNPVPGTVTRNYKTTGTITAEDESHLSFPSGGRLVSLSVDEGDIVEAGQVLAKVDSLQYQEGVNVYRALYNAASDTIMAQEAALDVAKNQLSDARNHFEKIEADYLRFQSLYENEVVTKKEFEDIETAYKSAELAVKSAQEGVKAGELQVEMAKEQESAAIAQLDRTEKALADATLYAPYAGVISERMMNVGELAGPGVSVFRLTGDGVRKVVLQIPEDYHGKVTVGDNVKIEIDYLPDEMIAGRVSMIVPDVNPESRTFNVDVMIPPEYDALPGSFCHAELELDKAEGVMTVPLSAVLSFEDEQGVFVNSDGVAEKRIVTVGLIEGETAQILDGLTYDDEVVILGNRFLNEGAKIEIRTPAAAQE